MSDNMHTEPSALFATGGPEGTARRNPPPVGPGPGAPAQPPAPTASPAMSSAASSAAAPTAAMPVPVDRPRVWASVPFEEKRSLVRAAVAGDPQALEEIIRAFIPDDERLISSGFLGSFGFLFQERAFFAVTDRRAISMRIGPFRHFYYADGLLEYINSSGIAQPSRGGLYLKLMVITVMTLGIGLLFLPLISRAWFRKHKDGLFLIVREGEPIVTYLDAKSLPTAMRLYRDFSLARDDRMAQLALSAV